MKVAAPEPTGFGDKNPADALLRQSLLLDLEVSLSGVIQKVGAVLGTRTFAGESGGGSSGSMPSLGRLAEQADLVLGHNLLRHDLARLREASPDHPVLQLPVIDTLVLSPLAFPRNPYHRLVKDYKLVRESANDPVADARLAAALFRDEVAAFVALREADPVLYGCLRFLLVTADDPQDRGAAGLQRLFAALGDKASPSVSAVLDRAHGWIRQRACRCVPIDDTLVRTSERRLSLAYALAWLNVAGSDSVLPPWVRHTFPGTDLLIRRLRDTPCSEPTCAYCRDVHDARAQLQRYFGFDDFRVQPSTPSGASLQREIVEAGMRGESLLAILPTGGGKSLCFQLPAIVRHWRRGALTVVISPLQALMKDQVDGLLRRTGAGFAATLNGLQTLPERGLVLDRVIRGDIALLYVSPEQLRNRSFENTIAQRDIGCWVFDEAHCLSKWGHDFRPDYLYAGRFIRERARAAGGDVPPIACFTATAKREVREEILEYFRAETHRDLRTFEGGVDRNNLEFEVESIGVHEKLPRVHELLSEGLRADRPGSAVVFRSRRVLTEVTADYLNERGWRAAHFHAGITPPEKKRIQNEFLAGQVQVICATNAFGMGIDKDDVRLVVHADTPGSLENYLQEAGRAGRDGQRAHCVLLYDEADCEDQFRLEGSTELRPRDLSQILRALRRRALRSRRDEIVVTTGEILRDDEIEIDLMPDDRNADSQVRTAISWLERAGFLQRDENVTSVFQARLLVRDLAEADARIARLDLHEREAARWRAILRVMINTPPTESLTVDRLALLPEFEEPEPDEPSRAKPPERVSVRVLRALRSMEQAALVRRDTRMTAFVRHKVADHSRLRLERLATTERSLVSLLAQTDPEPEGWVSLDLRAVNQRLLEDGVECSIDTLRGLLRSLSEDGRGSAGGQGSLELRHLSPHAYRVRLGRSWRAIEKLAERRRQVASCLLNVLMSKVAPQHSPGADVLVDFGFEELHAAIEADTPLRSEVRNLDAAVERGLMFLHEQGVIILQQGLAVFRSAMTLRLNPDQRHQRYLAADYAPLAHHYRERTFQVHVMSEYARLALQRVRDARDLVLAYFTVGKEEFLRRFFKTRKDLLEHATTARSFQRIVSDLGNAAQKRIVTAPTHRNLLVLAGPGSGKTKVVVHRCAYLLRVERVPARGILVVCFNRHAALELRQRLTDLVGDDARGVLIHTYHGLALRLLGRSLASPPGGDPACLDFDALIRDAIRLLTGERALAGLEADEVRDRLLTGFRHILVDEYQDIDEPQYEMIAALTGRTLEDADQRLSLLAVGDDDQSIYGFRGANVRFIRRFQEDYGATEHRLVENYRATRYLIEAANQAIAPNADRMKVHDPIRINQARELDPPGGRLGRLDPETRGKVQIIPVRDVREQARAVLAEIHRLRGLAVPPEATSAVLGETHQDLAQVRALMEAEGLPFRWLVGREALPPISHIREVRALLEQWGEQRHRLTTAARLLEEVTARHPSATDNPWVRFLRSQVEAWGRETGTTERPTTAALDFLYEACAETRRTGVCGDGTVLSTVHSAKGTEHDHVLLIGSWSLLIPQARREELRRVFYVGMTRARQSLTIVHRTGTGEGCADGLEGPAILRCSPRLPPAREPQPLIAYESLVPADLDLGYAGRFPANHPIHVALADLGPGDLLRIQDDGRGRWTLWSLQGALPIARLSQRGNAQWTERIPNIRAIRVIAMVHRNADQDPDPERRRHYRVTAWEYPACEVVLTVDDDRLFP